MLFQVAQGAVKLAFLTNLIPPYHKPLLKLLAARYTGFRVFISTPMEANRPWAPEWSGLDVVVQRGLHFKRSWLHPRGFGEAVTVHFPLDTIAQLARYKPDVVISVEMGVRTLLALIYARITRGCRLLIWTEVTAATEQGRGKMRGLVRRMLARNADGFLAVGAGGAAYVKSLGAPAEKIFQIAYTTDMQPFLRINAARSEQAARRLLYAGQLVERKGLEPFLKVMSQWAAAHPERQIEFVIAGDGPLAEVLRSTAMPANAKLLFRGALQYEELPSVYSQAGIFVLPTLADTWGVVVNEALASAVPVMGSVYSQAVNEMVEDGKTGWTFQPVSESDMYRALERAMLCSLDELAAMRQRARARALQITPELVASLIDTAVGAFA